MFGRKFSARAVFVMPWFCSQILDMPEIFACQHCWRVVPALWRNQGAPIFKKTFRSILKSKMSTLKLIFPTVGDKKKKVAPNWSHWCLYYQRLAAENHTVQQ